MISLKITNLNLKIVKWLVGCECPHSFSKYVLLMQAKKGKTAKKVFSGNCSIIHSSFFAGKNKEKTLHYSAFFNVRSIAAF